MKPLSDEEIQKLLESGKVFPEEKLPADYHLYQKVFKALQAEPEFNLPDHFSDRVVQRVRRQKALRKNVSYQLLLVLTPVLGIILGFAVMAYINMPLVLRWFGFLWQVKWLVLACMIFYIFIQISDQLVKRQVLHRSHPFF